MSETKRVCIFLQTQLKNKTLAVYKLQTLIFACDANVRETERQRLRVFCSLIKLTTPGGLVQPPHKFLMFFPLLQHLAVCSDCRQLMLGQQVVQVVPVNLPVLLLVHRREQAPGARTCATTVRCTCCTPRCHVSRRILPEMQISVVSWRRWQIMA